MARSRKAAAPPVRARPLPARTARLWLIALLVAHAALAVWGSLRSSVTFDENFHLPAGVMILERGNYTGSVAQPPLEKVLYALPAIALGARLPGEAAMASGDESTVGESFMRANADRYVRLFLAARLVALAMSLLLALLVWHWARVLYGEAAGVLAAALELLHPDVIAHASVVGTDLPTALLFTAALFAFWRYAQSASLRRWLLLALAVAGAFLTRFSAVELAPVFLLGAAWMHARRQLAQPRRIWLGIVALLPVVWLALSAGYAFQTYLGPIGSLPFRSQALRAMGHHIPQLRLALPLAYLGGLDYMSMLGEHAQTYLLGAIHTGAVAGYFPLAIVFKWPLALLAALLLRAIARPAGRHASATPSAEPLLAIAAVVTLAFAMFLTRYNFGVRYMLPLVPLACVWCGGLLAWHEAPAGRPLVRRAALALAGLLAIETLACAPWFLSFYNWPSGGPGGGDRLVNDSNVDWGQGLIALHETMRHYGIQRVHLAYLGTTDPALYGIDYVPYTGGNPGPQSDWLAVSSYYFVGLSQRMITPHGRTDFVRIDFSPLWHTRPFARPAHCMYLFRVR